MTAVVAAIEACAVALAGLAALALPAILLWLFTFDMAVDLSVMFGGTISVWLLAHFIPLKFRVSPEAALGYGLPPEAVDLTLSLAPLGLTLVTVLLAGRAGVRFARDGGGGAAGVIGGILGFAAATAVLAQFAVGIANVPQWIILTVPAATYGASSLAAFFARAVTDGHPWWRLLVRQLQRGLDALKLPGTAELPERALATMRLIAATLAGLLALSGFGIAVSLVAGYIEIITLAQGLQLDLVGVLVMFFAQLALLPLALIWGAAWFSGAGFAMGAGSSISPFGALTGPLPSLPLLGALPQGWGSTAVLAPALIVVLGLGIGVLGARLTRLRHDGWVTLVTVPVLAAAIAGLVVAGVSALAVGSVGPGRLSVVGPEPWTVGGLIAAELAVGLLLGVGVGRFDRERLKSALPQHVPNIPMPKLGSFTRDRRSARVAAGTFAENEIASNETVPIATAPVSSRPGNAEQGSGQSRRRKVTGLPLARKPVVASLSQSDPTQDNPTQDELTDAEAEALIQAFDWDQPHTEAHQSDLRQRDLRPSDLHQSDPTPQDTDPKPPRRKWWWPGAKGEGLD